MQAAFAVCSLRKESIVQRNISANYSSSPEYSETGPFVASVQTATLPPKVKVNFGKQPLH
jgi:hypothetical protein